MHKIDSPNAVSGQFATNAGLSGQDPTYLTPEWCNAVQGELVSVIAAAGLTLSKPDNTQLLAALGELFYSKAEVSSLLASERDAERDRLYPVGRGIYISYSADNPATVLGFGTWQLIGKGQALVGLSDIAGHPAWTKTIGGTAGEYSHALTVDELAAHQHGQTWGVSGIGETPAVDPSNAGDTDGYVTTTDYVQTSSGKKRVQTDAAGGSQPHNNVQPSFVAAIWLRVA